MLEWILARCDSAIGARETPVGLIPEAGALNIAGLDGIDDDIVETLLTVDPALWAAEVAEIRSYFTERLMRGDEDTPMPAALMQQLSELEDRLGVRPHSTSDDFYAAN